jgi:hypothetical protein
MVVPLMLFHQMQLMVCAWLARRYADRSNVQTSQHSSLADSCPRTDLPIGVGGAALDAKKISSPKL